MRRFIQEAKATPRSIIQTSRTSTRLAVLSIEGEGSTIGADTNFIAMEFIDGVTLREKIHRERTQLPKLLRYLQQWQKVSQRHTVPASFTAI